VYGQNGPESDSVSVSPNPAAALGAAGIIGASQDNTGVYGVSQNLDGVKGVSNAPLHAGVAAVNNSASNPDVPTGMRSRLPRTIPQFGPKVIRPAIL
jgi:hypothetical protein